ncbi:MAG: ATP-binding protein, partial [Caulobacterales bacterium]
DAMPGGGRLIVEAANAHLEEEDLQNAEGGLPGDYVMVAVTDVGEGMTAETRARAVEPFFTTKSDGKGSGLGLSMVYGFVRQSNGHMRLESEAGEGTSVRLYLPRSLADAPPEASPAVAAAKGGTETILVVEDDANVRSTAVTLLETLGYRCLQATDADGALELVKGGAPIDLVFSDVMMPGPTKTRDMANQLRRLAPGVPILFTSGYPREEIGEGGRLDVDVTLLAKPYSREALAAKIAQMLSEAAPLVPTA